MRTNVKTQSGNRLQINFDGKQVGLVQDVVENSDYAPEPASGIGDIHVAEWVPTMARHAINVSGMVLKKSNFRDQGIFALNGDDALKGQVFDIQVIDKDTNQPVREFIGCYYASGDVRIAKHAIIVSSGVFMCTDVRGTGL